MIYQVHQLLKIGQESFKKANIPTIEARLLLEYLLNTNFTQLLARYNEAIEAELVQKYKSYLQDRIEGNPLQYITNEQYFMGNKFYVNPSVLIPRPETEILVELCIEYIDQEIKKGKTDLHILDMCTGSGCIIISTAQAVVEKYPRLNIEWIGVDIQEDALKISEKNALKILDKPVIHWKKSDLFNQIESIETFDLIVSNPPYIPRYELQGLMREVKDHEPIIALDGGDDGLVFYRQIVDESFERLKNEGKLMFEIGHGQMQDIKRMMTLKGFSDIQEVNDIAGLERVISGTKN